MRNNKILFNLYQVYKYIVYLPFLAISTTVCGIVAAVLAIAVHPKIGTVMGIIWARLNAYMTPMFVKVIGKKNIDKNQSYIIISNHQSQFDIFLLYGWIPVDFKWVMKIELRQIPFLGYSCYKIGHVFIDRSNSQAAIDSINEAKKSITGGTSIIFFPEGHRSSDGRLLEFKKGAFKFALDMNLPLLPVTIIGTKDVLPSNTMALFPGKAKLIIHPPIEVTGYNEDNIQVLMDKAKDAIQKGFDEHHS